MTRKLYNLLPAGYNVKSVSHALTAGYIAAVVFSSFVFANSFYVSLGNLYYFDNGEMLRREGLMMLPYQYIRDDCFDAFSVFIICLTAFAVYNYLYHYIGSKSIYTMLRVGRRELIKRCVAVPLICVLIILVTIVILNFVWYAVYVFVVPYDALYPDYKEMWRFFYD